MDRTDSPDTLVSQVRIPSRQALLEGEARVPAGARGLVVFAHGSGSSRHSPRNALVARTLEAAGLGTLLFDLLTAAEEEVDDRTRHLRFDIDFLANRLSDALLWAERAPDLRGLALGVFGASTGAAAALVAAASLGDRVRAVVSRGGRPDLAGDALSRVRAPTLLIVGALDVYVLELNRAALEQVRGERRLEVVPGAGHLFEEAGTLSRVADLAAAWFVRHLGSRRAPAGVA
jgi:pimeloyl-ACP methyl ester carboxylesterase